MIPRYELHAAVARWAAVLLLLYRLAVPCPKLLGTLLATNRAIRISEKGLAIGAFIQFRKIAFTILGKKSKICTHFGVSFFHHYIIYIIIRHLGGFVKRDFKSASYLQICLLNYEQIVTF